MRANNQGKLKKKWKYFIYNPTPDYKSSKLSSKDKNPWIYSMSFSILGNNCR